jgi:hypothetical protein
MMDDLIAEVREELKEERLDAVDTEPASSEPEARAERPGENPG